MPWPKPKCPNIDGRLAELEQRVLLPASLKGETRIQTADAATASYPNFRRNLSLLSEREGAQP